MWAVQCLRPKLVTGLDLKDIASDTVCNQGCVRLCDASKCSLGAICTVMKTRDVECKAVERLFAARHVDTVRTKVMVYLKLQPLKVYLM